MMHYTVRLLAILIAACVASPANAQGLHNRERDYRFDMPSYIEAIKPMKHPLNGRMPLLLWSLPLPGGQQLVWSRQSGALRKAVDQLAARGIVPTVSLGPGSTPGGAVALAKTIQEAGQPVYIILARADLLESTCWRDCNIWVESGDASHRGKPRRWPCLPLANSALAVQWMTQQLQPLQSAGIKAAGVFFDDEALPHPWNGVYEAQLSSAECRAKYPPGVLDNQTSFQQYAYGLRAKLTKEVMADPTHRLFPGSIVGDYADFVSTAAIPFMDTNEVHYPPATCGGDAAMPSLYANTAELPRYFGPDEVITQSRVDPIYFHLLLRSGSSCAANMTDKRSIGKKLIPFVAQAVPDNPNPRYHLPLSHNLWRELLRHLWLRGADGMYIFNLGNPNSGITTNFSLQSVEEARSVLDEMLGHREFLDKGEPMNFATPKAFSGEPIWSGLRLPDRCLVRVMSTTREIVTVEVNAWPAVKAKLDAPPEGATYVVHLDGSVERAE